MAAPIPFSIAVVIFSIVCAGIYDVLTNFEDNGCEMTYMYEYPKYQVGLDLYLIEFDICYCVNVGKGFRKLVPAGLVLVGMAMTSPTLEIFSVSRARQFLGQHQKNHYFFAFLGISFIIVHY